MISLIIIFTMCTQPQDSIFTKKDTNGRIIERWGNENSWDNDRNFREYLKYNELGLLSESKYYPLDDDNTQCIVTDTLRYIKTIYTYKNEQLWIERKYAPVLDDSNKVVGHKLRFSYDHIKDHQINN